MLSLRLLSVLVIVTASAGCSNSSEGSASDVLPDEETGSDLVRAEVVGELPGDDVALDLVADEVGVELPFELEGGNRGWVTLRGLIHMHSAYSHDGCSPDGYEDNGGPDPQCLAELRAAPCGQDIQFMFMTDHPGHASEHSFEELAQHRPELGDELVLDSQQRPFANKVTCPSGAGQGEYYFFVGTEGHKNMPIGMAGPIPLAVFNTDYGVEAPLEPGIEAVAMARELGGMAMAVHTEQDNISAQRIIDLDLDGMEIYNLHANLMDMLKGTLTSLFAMENFMDETMVDPPADLSLLLFLAPLEASVEKVNIVAAVKHLVTFIATDIHRNVEFPLLCPAGPDKGMCASLVEESPNFAKLLATGGPVMLKDGERMDSYNRAMRWFSNRVLAKDDSAHEIREAVRAGRIFSAFDTLGNPEGFEFLLWTGAEVVEMGGEAQAGQGSVIFVRTPKVGPAPWDPARQLDFGLAQMTTRIIRMTPEGAEIVAEQSGQGVVLQAPADKAGAYRVEVWIVPKHLKSVLKGVEAKASTSFPYIYASPIFVN